MKKNRRGFDEDLRNLIAAQKTQRAVVGMLFSEELMLSQAAYLPIPRAVWNGWRAILCRTRNVRAL